MTNQQALDVVEKFTANAKRVQEEHYAQHRGENHVFRLVHVIDDEFVHFLFSRFYMFQEDIDEEIEKLVLKFYDGLADEEKKLIQTIRSVQSKHVNYDDMLLKNPYLLSYELFESDSSIYESVQSLNERELGKMRGKSSLLNLQSKVFNFFLT